MFKLPKSLSPSIARLANYSKNPVTILGFGLTNLACVSLIIFLFLEATGQIDNPYTGLFGSALRLVAHAARVCALRARRSRF